MASSSYAIVAAGSVTNVALWDGEAAWTPPAGSQAIAIPEGVSAGIGYAYAGGTFSAPAAPALSAAQIAQNAYDDLIAGGLTVTSTGTPALNGVYAIDAQSQSDISTEAQFVSTFAEFTTGATTNLPWQLANGTIVAFPTTTEFMGFAKASAQLVAAAKLAQAEGAAMPAATATIP